MTARGIDLRYFGKVWDEYNQQIQIQPARSGYAVAA